jgi:LacI family transcriptional regulator
MSVTIRDVARRAGVSISTVSRVLNDTCPVGEDKRRSVVEAAQALGYRPNPAARSLLGKKTGGLGVLLPYVSGEFFAELLNGLDEAAQEEGVFLVVSTSHGHVDEFNAAIHAMDRRVDGLIVMAPEMEAPGIESIVASRTPVSFINTHVEGLRADVFNFDNYGGSHALTQHLLGLGHRRIAIVRGPAGAGDAEERVRGYRAAMAEAGLPDTSALEFGGDYTQAAGVEAAKAVLDTNPRPTAIVAANDYCASGVLSALNERGVAIPAEMAVTGFDGVTSSQYTLPPLTTMRAPVREVGYQAFRRLVARLNGTVSGDAFQHEVLPVELVVRGSTAAPSKGESYFDYGL